MKYKMPPWNLDALLSPEHGFGQYIYYHYLFYFIWPYCEACRIFVPWPGTEPGPSAVEAQSLNGWTAKEVPGKHFKL